MPSQADMGAAAGANVGMDAAAGANPGMDAAGRAGAATEALGSAGPGDHAMDAVGNSPANDRATQALEEAGPADAAFNAPDADASDDNEMSGSANANASLTGKVQSTLHSNSELRGQNIKSEISEDGSVTLNGSVESSAQKETAEKLVADIEGVSTVNSNLIVEGN
ncbi:MAG: BON domain-containing protein [Pseudomonadales bacterium]|nr:BON domain-containing protein [Pseudomonadales bacterium]